MMNTARIRTSAAVGLATLTLVLAPALPALAQEEFLPETKQAELDPANRDAEIGELIFRGGVEIAPDKAGIGGISGLEWHDGQLHAITDDGRWIVIKPDDIAGRLVDVSSVTIGDLRDVKGGKLGSKDRGDAEAITRLPGGEWLIAFEQQHRIWQYAELGGNATDPSARSDIAALAALVADAQPNGGIETMAASPNTLLACGEWVDPARPNCVQASAGGIARFHLPAPVGIAEVGGVPTDAACKADGTCYVLFRSYVEGQGNRAAIVELGPDADPKTLAVLSPPLMLDNFEGIAVREAQGRTYLYLISDDNFRNCATKSADDCQRTLLYKFAIKGPPVVLPPPTPESLADTSTARPGIRPFPDAATIPVVIITSLGRITIELETERAPITARNFLRYVDEKRFDGTTFYRAVNYEREPLPNGLLQGGTRGEAKRVRAPIAHEPTNVTGLTHTHGAVSMAMDGPGTADGDFFIAIEDQTGFDAEPSSSDPGWRDGFPVFAYVTSGMDVVAAIHAAARDADAGEGVMRGEMLAQPVKIISARRQPQAPLPPSSPSPSSQPTPQ